MKTALRFRSLALTGAMSWVVILPAAADAAEGGESAEALPGIFAPKRVPEAPAAASPVVRRAGSSERISGMLRERLLERAQAFDASTLPIARPTGEVSRVVMERFVVRSEKVTRVDPEEQISPVLRFLRTGRFFESRDGLTTGDMRLVPAMPAGALAKEPVMRVEISFTRKF